ncbi:MAG: sugar phosphate isomerase/epimerase [Thermomicrobia bacterium]|nr:sugar phosphate isomerase/epimerase [Thermomicrobia bacterium]MCA1724298.1 sugar phosphate isomerase/epimerase [Thermomicrobia bacterium]
MSIKLAYSTLACPTWSLDEMIDATKRYGFDGIEMRLLDGEIVPPDLPADDRERVATACKAAGVPICCLDTSLRIAQSATNADARRAAQRDAAAYLELAAAWGAPLIRVFGGEPEDGRSPAEVVGPMADLLGTIGQRAEHLGVGIALETHDFFSATPDVMRVLDQVQNRHVGVLWDTHHPYRMGEAVAETYERVVSRLLHVHVKDARKDERERTGWKLVLLGEGEVPVAETVTYLRSVGYDKWIAVEWEKKWHPEIEPPEIALPHDGALLRAWLNG